MKNPWVVIAVGYSVRSLVGACAYAALDCVAVDHFGDADTRACASGRWIKLELVNELLIAGATLAAIQNVASEFEREGRSVVFVLAGGMENLGDAVEQLNCIGKVFGPNETQRTKLRDWRFLEASARAVGIEFPRTICDRDERLGESLHSENWLWKPICGAGGLKIVRGDDLSRIQSEGYWQQFVAGRQLGVSCVLQAASCSIVGTTRSLDAEDWPGPSEFIYRGSIGPVQLSIDAQQQVKDLCVFIREQLGFLGLLQFDFIQGEDDRLWLLECNPRWTAGMEVLLGLRESGERARRLIVDCILGNGEYLPEDPANSGWSFAKAIVYANKELHLSEQMVIELHRQCKADSSGFNWLADIPYSAQTIELGHPIATVRAKLRKHSNHLNEADVGSQLLAGLKSCAERLYRCMGSTTGCES